MVEVSPAGLDNTPLCWRRVAQERDGRPLTRPRVWVRRVQRRQPLRTIIPELLPVMETPFNEIRRGRGAVDRANTSTV